MVTSLAEFDGRIAQAAAILIAALVTSAAALIVAYFVYPKQKEKDRENEIRAERRVLYREWIDALEICRLKASVSGNDTPELLSAFQKFHSLTQQISVSAPDGVSEKCAELLKPVLEMTTIATQKEPSKTEMKEIGVTIRSRLQLALEEMRKDTFSSTRLSLAKFVPSLEFSVSIGSTSDKK